MIKSYFTYLLLIVSIICKAQTPILQSSVSSELQVCQTTGTNSCKIFNTSSTALTDLQIGLKLPVGISYESGSLNETTSKNLSVTRVVVDSGIIISSNNLAAGDSIIFTLDYAASTLAIDEQNNGIVFRNRLSVTHSNGTSSLNSNSYNILYPVLAIVSTSPKNQTIISGTATSRVVKVLNGGNGRLSSLWLTDTRNSSEVTLDSCNIGQLQGDSILLGATEFSSVGNGDNYLDQNESIDVTQYLTGISCTDKTVTSTLQTHWGCENNLIGSSTTYSSIHIDFKTPNLVLSTTESFGSCFGSGLGYEQGLTIINKGTGVASNVVVDIYKSKGSNYNQDILSRIDVSSIRYKIGVNGSLIAPSAPNTYVSTPSSLIALGSNPIGRVDFNAGNINPQDTLIVIWDMISTCISGCSNQRVKGWKVELDYSDVCSIASYSTSQKGQDDNEQYASVFSEAPADIFNNQTETYTFLISSFKNTLPSSPGAYYKVSFNGENGLDYNDLTLSNNGINWAPSSVVYDSTSRTVTAKYPLPAPFIITKSEFNLKLDGNCGTSGWKSITMNLYYVADTSCITGCQIPLICNYQTSTYLQCSGANCDGLSFNSFTINRSNLGTPDNNLDGLPDSSGNINFNEIKTNRAMVGDTILSIAKAVVSGSTNYSYASFSTTATYGSVLDPIQANLKVYDSSNSTWYTVNSLSIMTTTTGTSKTFTINLSSNVLGAINSSLTGYSFANGDSLKLEMTYEVSASVSGLLKESTFSNEFYVSSFASPTAAQKKQCTSRNGRITILGYNFRNDKRNYFTLKNCTQNIQQNFGMSIGTEGTNYAGGNLFPYEYRHWGQVTKAQVTIPNGYSVEKAKIIYYRTVKTNVTNRKTINNLSADTVNGNTYTYDFEKHFTSGALTRSDDGFNGTLFLTLAPTCTGVARGYEDIVWTFEYQKTDAIDGLSSGQITTVADKIRYTPAALTLSSMNPIQDANTKYVNWDYKIKNTTSSNAENVWVYLDVPTTLTVDSIVNDKTNIALTPVNGFYEYGTISASQTADLTIYGAFSNCDTVDYTVHTGYSCDGYPTDINNPGCYAKNLALRVEPKKAQYQVRLTDELMADPCQPMVSITADITSVEIAHMYDMKLTVLSTDTTKIKVVSGSSNFRYGTDSFVSAQNPTFSSGAYEYDINDNNTSFPANGIPGILSAPNNNYKVQFLVEMGANYQPGDYLQLQIEGSNACGHVLPTMQFAVDLNSSFKKDETAGLNIDIGNSWSASWGDYDNDGYDDLFVPINDIDKPNILYHNNGNGTFTKITSGTIVTDLGSSIAGVWGDYDNDGFLDLFVANNVNSSNKLYHNNGNGSFTSITNSPVVEKGIYSHAAAWADFNRDGNLDLVVSDFHPTNYNFIFIGDGNGGFTEDVTNEVALSATSAVGISWGDYDNDGDPDLFIANTNGENNQLFNNQAGVLTAITTGAIVSNGGTSVGGTWGDYDNDGDLDLFVTNSRITEANFFYENDGDGTFTKIITGELVTNASASNGASWIDFDNDGYLDLMVANDQGQANFLFRNNGNSTFTKLDNAITQETSNSFGTSWSDFDNDGDYDLIVANRGANANDFFINGKGSCTNHLPIKLTGCNSNKSAIGAMIKVKSTINGVSIWQTKDVATQNSAMGGQNSQKILFGLGDASTVDSVSVYWPSGIVTHITNASINNLLTITEQCGSQVCGVVYHDANGNGTQDSTELGIPNRSITVTPGDYQVYTGTDGQYEFFLTDGTYSLALNTTSAWSQTTPSSNGSISLTITQATQSVYCGNDFGNYSNCTSPDLTISIGNTAMRRGLLNDLNVKITNQGAYSTTSSVDVEITMSDDVYLTDTNYSSISTINNLRTYTFSLGSIAALSDSILLLTDSVDVYATLNDTISVFAKVIYGGTECDTTDNYASFSDIIVGSVDPNDKQVFINNENARYKMSESHDELLSYKIRFQNLGNYAARRVQIVDTLSSLLDWSTFQKTGSSHDFKVSIANGVITWVNEQIELPSVEDNEEESNGFVTYIIAPNNDVAPYTIVHNVANIQFDRNAYIATNDASAVVGLGNLELNKTKLIVYPNPANVITSILLVDKDQRPIEIKSIEVLSMTGSIDSVFEPSELKTELNISELVNGIYSLRITSARGEKYYKKFIKN
jgi:hypothetical protein